MGRPRKSTKLKLLHGNPGKRKLPKEREVPQSAAVKPKWLDVLASPVWDEMAPTRMQIGVLTNLTQEAFGQLCTLLGEFRRAHGTLKPAQLTHLRALMNAFGFDPGALTKLGIACGSDGRPQNPFGGLSTG